MLPIDGLAIALRCGKQGVLPDPAVLVGDLLGHRYRKVLGPLDAPHELPCLVERLHGAGVEPGIATPQRHDGEGAVLEIHLVERGDLELSPGGGPHLRSQVADAGVVEVEACHGIGALRMLRLLLDGYGIEILVELDDAEALGVVHMVAEDRGSPFMLGTLRSPAQVPREAVAVEDVVTQHESAGASIDELPADDEGLGKAVWGGLLGIGEAYPELGAISQQPLEVREVMGRRNDQDVAYACKHEGRERVVDHRLVVDRQELLARDARERIEPGAATSS